MRLALKLYRQVDDGKIVYMVNVSFRYSIQKSTSQNQTNLFVV